MHRASAKIGKYGDLENIIFRILMILEIKKYLNSILIAHVYIYVYLSDKRMLFHKDFFFRMARLPTRD